MSIKYWLQKQKSSLSLKLKKMMKCICSGEHLRADEIIPSSESLATRDYSAGFSSRAGENDPKADTSNIEEAESSLRESGFLNYEEARALLGRLEYQKGNVEAALRVFEGIDIAAVIPRMKITLVRKNDIPRRHSQSDNIPPMSMHAVSLLIEAIFLKAKSLEALGRYTEAAQSCKVILDTFEFSIPEGLYENFASDCKLLETINKAVELLPELYKLAYSPQEAIVAYRRALLYQWNLDIETRTKIEKDFAIFLLYSGNEAGPPTLRSQMESSFVPKNNIEEAVLLLLLILNKFVLKKIEWDPSILNHLTFALSMAGEFTSLACQIEELPSGTIDGKEKYTSLAVCYHAQGDDSVSLNLLRNLLNNRENCNDSGFELLLASKICLEDSNSNSIEEGIGYIRKILDGNEKCCGKVSFANYLLGLARSAQSRGVVSDSQRILKQSEALKAFENAREMTNGRNSDVLFSLSLENAEQRKLDNAVYYAKELLKLEGGSSVKSWILLARILSAQKRYLDAENIIDAALEEAGKWEQGELLRTKGKLQIVQGNLKDGIETYTKLLAVLQVQRKSSRVSKMILKNNITSLEMETWHDLANLYTSLSQWRDAEICLSKSEAINPHSASRLHSAGLLYEAKGQQKDALKSFEKALDIDPNHVPSLISTAIVLRQISKQSLPVVKSFLSDALRLDRTNPTAWYNLGLLYKTENGGSALEAAECFEAAAVLQESEPVEPFR